MSDSLETLEQAIQSQIDKIDEAIVKARQNELIDMGDMDDAVATICQKIMHSEDKEMNRLEGRMIEMINKLDELAVELKGYQDRLAEDG